MYFLCTHFMLVCACVSEMFPVARREAQSNVDKTTNMLCERANAGLGDWIDITASKECYTIKVSGWCPTAGCTFVLDQLKSGAPQMCSKLVPSAPPTSAPPASEYPSTSPTSWPTTSECRDHPRCLEAGQLAEDQCCPRENGLFYSCCDNTVAPSTSPSASPSG